MPLDKKVFDSQIRGLLVARGNFVSKDKEIEIKRFWYEEFKNCNQAAFVKTITQLKFSGDPDKFPSFQEFKILYRIIRPRSLEPVKKFCGKCVNGTLMLWDADKDIYSVALCSICVADTGQQTGSFDPNTLESVGGDVRGTFYHPEVA